MNSAEQVPQFELDPGWDFELVLSAANSRLQDAQRAQAESPDKLYFDVAKDHALDEYFANYVLGAQTKRPWQDELIEIGLQVVSDDVNNPQLAMTGLAAHFKVAWPNSSVVAEQKLHLVDKNLYVAELTHPVGLPQLPKLLGKLTNYRLVAIS